MENCKGFEYNFINMSNSELKAHLKTCQECQKEYFLMKQTQTSVRELKPYFKKDKKISFVKISSIAAVFVMTIMGANVYEEFQSDQILASLSQDEYIQDGILPLDEYGLISID